MYKIVKERRAWWAVTFNGVTEEGRTVENKIELRFIIHGEDEHAKLIAYSGELAERAEALAREELNGEDISETVRQERTITVLSKLYAEFLQKIAVDWRGVGGENGEPLKFEDEHIRLLMNVPGVFKAAVDAYGKCRLGEKDVRAGN